MLIAILALYADIHLYKVRKRINVSHLDSYIEACCIWMFYLFAMTELLSEFHAVRFLALFAGWTLMDIILVAVLVVQISKIDLGIKDLCSKGQFGVIHTIRQYPYYGITGMLGVVVLVLAFKITPYNWDSMTYHLSRIAYWVQNRSVEHYATNNIREIASPVLGEFVNLHVYILMRGRDTLFNMLQALSYVTCAFMVERIAHRLGCSRVFGFLASLIYMTMPIAYAEALTTQVDNFATVWLLYYVYILLDLVQRRESLRLEGTVVCKVCAMGLCVAWGYLAKPSVCIAMVVFALWLLARCIARKDKAKELFRLALCALPCVVLPLVPELVRNFKTFHSYASKSTGARQLVATLQPSYLFVNFLKNLTFNMPTALIKDSNEFFAKIAETASRLLHVELNAEAISENSVEFGLHEANTYGCDTAINPLVLWLFIFCVCWALCAIRKIDWKDIKAGYWLTSVISFCLFCTILRWEPFVSRYMVSYLALLCPMIVSCIQVGTKEAHAGPFRHAMIGIIGFLCVMEAVSVTAFHYDIYAHQGANSRPYGYFACRRSETACYVEMADEIKSRNYERVGLYLRLADDYEYPIWAMLGDQRIEHVNVRNVSAVYADSDFTPDCIIWFGSLPEEPIVVNGAKYTLVKDYGERQYLLEMN